MRLLLFLGACAARSPAPAPAPEPTLASPAEEAAAVFPRDYAPVDLDGAPVPFAAWEGQPVLVNLWASWCPPCLEELPVLQQVQAEHAARGLVLVGVAVDDPPERLARAIADRGITWPVATDGSVRASQTFDTLELPTTLLYAPDGQEVWKHVGPLEAGDPGLAAALQAVLGD